MVTSSLLPSSLPAQWERKAGEEEEAPKHRREVANRGVCLCRATQQQSAVDKGYLLVTSLIKKNVQELSMGWSEKRIILSENIVNMTFFFFFLTSSNVWP